MKSASSVRPLDELMAELAPVPDRWGVFGEHDGDAFTGHVTVVEPGAKIRHDLDFVTPEGRRAALTVVRCFPDAVQTSLNEFLAEMASWSTGHGAGRA